MDKNCHKGGKEAETETGITTKTDNLEHNLKEEREGAENRECRPKKVKQRQYV